MASITKKSISNIVAGIVVISAVVKGFITSEFNEVDLLLLGTAMGYLFGAATTTASRPRQTDNT